MKSVSGVRENRSNRRHRNYVCKQRNELSCKRRHEWAMRIVSYQENQSEGQKEMFLIDFVLFKYWEKVKVILLKGNVTLTVTNIYDFFFSFETGTR